MTQCTTCDRREATQDEWLDIAPGERPDLCFGEGDCTDRAVDWRERALTLSAALDEARRERDEARSERDAVERTVQGCRARARAAAIEECAKVCDASEVRWREQAHDVRADLAEFLATRIRVLLEPQQ